MCSNLLVCVQTYVTFRKTSVWLFKTAQMSESTCKQNGHACANTLALNVATPWPMLAGMLIPVLPPCFCFTRSCAHQHVQVSVCSFAARMSTSFLAAMAVARAPACKPCSAAWGLRRGPQAAPPRWSSSSRPAAHMLLQPFPCGTRGMTHSTQPCMEASSPLSARSPSHPPPSPSRTLLAGK